jgi:uncharacterized protein (DUF488 family)
MTIFTIGYEGIDIDRFMALLREHGIETVVDIRELPLSRKQGFSKKTLANLLNLSGFEYTHLSQLGCPKPVRDRYKIDGNWKRYTEGFQEYLKTQDAAIAELSELATYSNCALLCYEADSNFCHRSMVANAVHKKSGSDVMHIKISGAKTTRTVSLPLTFA